MSERSQELRKRARELTRHPNIDDDPDDRELSLGLAQACIALARNEEWLDGEISPVDAAAPYRSAQPDALT
jgi:hypothetical protein